MKLGYPLMTSYCFFINPDHVSFLFFKEIYCQDLRNRMPSKIYGFDECLSFHHSSRKREEFCQQYPPGTQEYFNSFLLIIPLTQNGKKLEGPKGGRGLRGTWSLRDHNLGSPKVSLREEPARRAPLDDLRSSEPGVPP